MKTFGKIIRTIISIFAIVLLIAILLPIAYFAWRAGQPMSMPEYGGRTYYELLAERRQAYAELAQEYQSSHPSVDVKFEMCFQNEFLMSAGYTFPWAGICALSEVVSPLQGFIGPRARQAGCGHEENNSWLNFLNSWWMNFERMQYSMYEHRTAGPVVYCRIPVP